MNEIKIRSKRSLNKKEQYFYAAGYFGLMLPLSTFNAFFYSYVIYVIGLEELKASIGTFLGILFFAFAGTFWGYLSDKKKPGKMGRRRPFLLWGGPLYTLLFVMLWFLPIDLNSPERPGFGFTIYFWILCIIFCTIYMSVWSPYMSMLPDISEDETNRIEISQKQGIFNMVATVIGLLLPFILLSGVQNPQTELFHDRNLYNQMILISIIFGILALCTIYMTAFKIKEPIVVSSKDDDKEKSNVSLKDMFNSVLQPFKHKHFVFWSGANFFVNLGMRIPMTIITGFLIYVLNLEQEEIVIFIGLLLPFVGMGFVIWSKLAKKWGLKKSYETVLLLLTFFMGFGLVLLIDFPAFLKTVIGFVLMVILVSCLIALFILPNPIVARLIDLQIQDAIEKNGPFKDENEKFKFAGKNYGANALTLNLAGAIAFIILGLFLKGGNGSNPVILTILLPITGIIIFIAYIFARKMQLNPEKI
ncbi:MAG: MFS transporter [Promethearchaeota archaeon]